MGPFSIIICKPEGHSKVLFIIVNMYSNVMWAGDAEVALKEQKILFWNCFYSLGYNILEKYKQWWFWVKIIYNCTTNKTFLNFKPIVLVKHEAE